MNHKVYAAFVAIFFLLLIIIAAANSDASSDRGRLVEPDSNGELGEPDLQSQLNLECQWGRWFTARFKNTCSHLSPPSVSVPYQHGTSDLNFWTLLAYISVRPQSREVERSISDMVESMLATRYLDGFWGTVPEFIHDPEDRYEPHMTPLKSFGAKRYSVPDAQTFSPRVESDSNWLKGWLEERLPFERRQVSFNGAPKQTWRCVWRSNSFFKGCMGLLSTTLFYIHLDGSEGPPYWSDSSAPTASIVWGVRGPRGESLKDISWSQRGNLQLYRPEEPGFNNYAKITYPPAKGQDAKLAYTGLWARRDVLEKLTGNRIYDGDIIEIVASLGSLVIGPSGQRDSNSTGIVLTEIESISSLEPPACENITDGFCTIDSENGPQLTVIKMKGDVHH